MTYSPNYANRVRKLVKLEITYNISSHKRYCQFPVSPIEIGYSPILLKKIYFLFIDLLLKT